MNLSERVINWIRDYLNSFGGKTKAVIGISGGKDSTIAAALCVEAVGKDRVIGVRLPQGKQYDLDVARKVCDYLGIKSYEFNIEETVESINLTLNNTFGLALYWEDAYKTNTPARVRMTYLYSIAALEGDCRVVNTSNLSETYIGYSTKFGDGAGDFSPLADLTVAEVLIIGEQLDLPEKFIYKAPEDGLSGKTDEENLGFSYKKLDDYLLYNKKIDKETLEKIEARHTANLHKVMPMPKFKK